MAELTKEEEIIAFEERIKNHYDRKSQYVNQYVWRAELKKLVTEFRELKKKYVL